MKYPRRGAAEPVESGAAHPGRAYRLVMPLDKVGGACQRWLALDPAAQTNHVLYDLRPWGARFGASAVRRVFESRAALQDPHILGIDDVWGDEGSGELWACSPYVGHHRGLVRLDDVVSLKGGQLPQAEAARAVEQVLRALAAAHGIGAAAGRIEWSQVLVDRSGTVRLELHAIEASLGLDPEPGIADRCRDEVVAAVGLFYRLVTGRLLDDVQAPLSGYLNRQRAAWEAWLERGIDPAGGYATAAEALAAMPTVGGLAAPAEPSPVPGPAMVVARRLRNAMRGAGWRSE